MALPFHSRTSNDHTAESFDNHLGIKWPQIFKRHINVLKSHIRSLDELMQEVKSESDCLNPADKLDWELNEKGNWRMLCRMIDAAREILVQARAAAEGILPECSLQDKNDLDFIGATFVKIEPQLEAKAKALGYDIKMKRGPRITSSHAIARSKDATKSKADFSTIIPANLSQTRSDSNSKSSIRSQTKVEELIMPKKSEEVFSKSSLDPSNLAVEYNFLSNPHDTCQNDCKGFELNNYRIKETIEINSHKRRKSHDRKNRKRSAPFNDTEEHRLSVAEEVETEVDFTALQVKLQAEIEANENAKQAHAALAESCSKHLKKRRRNSDEVLEKMKRTKMDKAIKKQKRKWKVVDSELDPEADTEKKKKRIRKRE